MSKNTNIADLINYISVDGSGNVVLTTGGQVATQSYVTTAVSNLVNSAPTTLDTLNELATALGNDANFATTVTNSIATKLPLSGGTLTGALNGTSGTFSSTLFSSEAIIVNSGGASDTIGDGNSIYLGMGSGSSSNNILQTGVGKFFIAGFGPSGWTNYLTINNTTGATTLAGALNGTSATFSGDLTLNNGSADGGQLVLMSSGYSNWNIDNYSGSLRAYYGSSVAFSIASNLAATFSSSVTATSGIIDAGGLNIKGTGGVAKPDMLRLSNASAGGYYWDIWRDNTTGYLNFGAATGGSLSTFLTIKDVTGNVGINIINPNANLHVNAGSGLLTKDILIVQGGGSPSGNYGFSCLANNGDKIFYTDHLTYNVIMATTGGKVGIGTTTTTYGKLSLNATTIDALRIDSNTGYNAISIGGTGKFSIDAPGIGSGRFLVNDNGHVLTPKQPAFMAYGNGNTTIDNNGTYLIYPSVHFNRGGHYDSSTGTFTAPVSGLYYFSWSSIGNNYNEVWRYFFRVNGSTFLGDYHLRIDTNATGDEYGTNGNRSVIINLSAGDNVRIWFRNDAGNTMYGINDATNSYHNFMGYLIG